MSRIPLLAAIVLCSFALAAPAGAQAAPSVPEDLTMDADLEYGRVGDHVLRLDLCRPRRPAGDRLPAVIVIHGGGWQSGRKEDMILATTGFAQRGYVAASINYRLSGVALFPAAVEDAKCAVRWLRANAAQYGVDADRIGAFGVSAGGHLALLLALVDDTEGMEGTGGNPGVSSWVRAACGWCAPSDFRRGEMEFAPNIRPLLTSFLGRRFAEDAEPYRRGSPATYATWDDAPILLVHGDRDPVVPFDQSERMLEACRRAGAECRLIRVRNGDHGFQPADAPATEPGFLEVVEETYRFFEAKVKGR